MRFTNGPLGLLGPLGPLFYAPGVTFLSPIISIREGVGETFADAITIIRGDVFNLQGKWGTKTASGLLFFVSLGP